MRMLGATAFYFFHKQYYDSLLQLLHNNIILITAFNKKQKPIASSMYTYCQKSGIMQHHLGGTLDDYRELQPSKLITHEARQWGRENHYKVLHFGGGLGAQKTLYMNIRKVLAQIAIYSRLTALWLIKMYIINYVTKGVQKNRFTINRVFSTYRK